MRFLCTILRRGMGAGEEIGQTDSDTESRAKLNGAIVFPQEIPCAENITHGSVTTRSHDYMTRRSDMSRPTIAELEAILDREEEVEIEILPNGEVRAKGQSTLQETGGRKPLTMREDLGGEYSEG